MNRHSWLVTLLVASMISFGWVGNAAAQGSGADKVAMAISNAETAVAQARAAIENGREIVGQIPENSPYLMQVEQMLKAASENWKQAVSSLESAKESAEKLASASDDTRAQDLALLAKVNANAATAGANVVKIALSYVEAVANNKTESLGVIQQAMRGALASSNRLQLNYDKIKTLISEKYSQ